MTSNDIGIRSRKIQENGASPLERRSGSLKGKSNVRPKTGLQSSFLCLIFCMLLLIIAFGIYTDTFHPIVDHIAIKLGYKQLQYAVIIDAGSTGSRVLAYEFHRGYLDGRLVLDNEIFKEIKPGLSSFHEKPTDGAKTIQQLLEEAKKFVPESLWKSTPLVLKATAGLRLLLPAQADALLNEVRDIFIVSGFSVKDDAVEIMDGVDEGIFSWFTVNFLLGRLNSQNTVAALDLGGGSTQVTFAPKDAQQTPLFADFMHTVPTLSSSIDVFTHSYLHLGLMAVRHAVFTHGKTGNVLSSECVNQIVTNKLWKYANTDYYVSGQPNPKAPKDNPVVDFDLCAASIKRHALPLINPKPVTLKHHQISAFSYFFERSIETGLIDPFEGGEVTVGDVFKKAKEICTIPNTDQPFMCLDLTYIAILLQDGYDLRPKTKVKLFKKIEGHEISWALGCAYNLLTSSGKKA